MQLTRTGPISRWKLKSKSTSHFESQYGIHRSSSQSQKPIHCYEKKYDYYLPIYNTDIKAEEASNDRTQQFCKADKVVSSTDLSSLKLDSEPNTPSQTLEGHCHPKLLLGYFLCNNPNTCFPKFKQLLFLRNYFLLVWTVYFKDNVIYQKPVLGGGVLF